MVRWHHRCNGPVLRQTPGSGEQEVWCVAVYRVVKSLTYLLTSKTATGSYHTESEQPVQKTEYKRT